PKRASNPPSLAPGLPLTEASHARERALGLSPGSSPARAPSPARVPVELYAEPVSMRSGMMWAWVLAVLLTLGALGLVIVRLKDKERESDEQAQILEDAKKKTVVRQGDVTLDSDPSEAAVWLLLGKTPLDTMPLDTSKPYYELRVELEGYKA